MGILRTLAAKMAADKTEAAELEAEARAESRLMAMEATDTTSPPPDILALVRPRRERCTDYRIPYCSFQCCPWYLYDYNGSRCTFYDHLGSDATLPHMCWDCELCMPALAYEGTR
jgi:hypothetical protein